MCVYVCECVCIYVCVCRCLIVHVRVQVGVAVQLCVCKRPCVCVCVCACLYMWVCIHIYPVSWVNLHFTTTPLVVPLVAKLLEQLNCNAVVVVCHPLSSCSTCLELWEQSSLLTVPLSISFCLFSLSMCVVVSLSSLPLWVSLLFPPPPPPAWWSSSCVPGLSVWHLIGGGLVRRGSCVVLGSSSQVLPR